MLYEAKPAPATNKRTSTLQAGDTLAKSACSKPVERTADVEAKEDARSLVVSRLEFIRP